MSKEFKELRLGMYCKIKERFMLPADSKYDIFQYLYHTPFSFPSGPISLAGKNVCTPLFMLPKDIKMIYFNIYLCFFFFLFYLGHKIGILPFNNNVFQIYISFVKRRSMFYLSLGISDILNKDY